MLVALLAAAAVLLWPRRRPGLAVRPPPAASEGAGPAGLGDAAVALTLLAAVLRGGGGTVESLEAVAAVDPGAAGTELAVVAAAHRWGVPPEQAWAHVGPGWAPAATAWHAAVTAGAAPAALVEEAARRIREQDARRVEAAVHRAGVLVVLPLGLCFLPGFVATTVVPVVLVLLADGLGG
ncbi:type II secretion system F family protein [Phycicoccus flavus]|uniref:type II secretion system F family protein n=1 Tax=Phycicoccus flavus TaxID=2502783 RepID=UPI000FEBE4B7|nr:type II secretion system F family protein [Phycicoccus flavus]NHA68290.1 secretion system protein [Phycicoccus flavus]